MDETPKQLLSPDGWDRGMLCAAKAVYDTGDDETAWLILAVARVECLDLGKVDPLYMRMLSRFKNR